MMNYAHGPPSSHIQPTVKKPRSKKTDPNNANNYVNGKNEKEKPFACPHAGCEARFPRMYNLKSHILCHTGMFLQV